MPEANLFFVPLKKLIKRTIGCLTSTHRSFVHEFGSRLRTKTIYQTRLCVAVAGIIKVLITFRINSSFSRVMVSSLGNLRFFINGFTPRLVDIHIRLARCALHYTQKYWNNVNMVCHNCFDQWPYRWSWIDQIENSFK